MPDFSGRFTRELSREIEKLEKRTGIKVLGFAFSMPEKVEGTVYGMAWFDNVNLRTEEEWYSAMEMERVPETPKHAEIIQKKPN